MKRSISKYLINLRVSRNLTQFELGKELGMSRSKVSSWEIGRRDLSISDAVIIADYFNISLDHLLNPDGVNSDKVRDLFELYLNNSKILYKEKEILFDELQEKSDDFLEKNYSAENNIP